MKSEMSGELALKGKPVSASRSEMTEIVLPAQTNPLGKLLGGQVMHLVDMVAAMAAHRHSNSYVVTASVDYIDFRNPSESGRDCEFEIASESSVPDVDGSRRRSLFGKCDDRGTQAYDDRRM